MAGTSWADHASLPARVSHFYEEAPLPIGVFAQKDALRLDRIKVRAVSLLLPGSK
jgi:hypothetical protein